MKCTGGRTPNKETMVENMQAEKDMNFNRGKWYGKSSSGMENRRSKMKSDITLGKPQWVKTN